MRDLDKWTFMSEPSIEKYAIIISTELSNVNREKHKRKSNRFFPTESPSEHKYPSSYYTFNSLSLFWLDKSRNANLRRSQIWRLFFRTSTSSFPRPNSPMRSPAPRKCLFWFTPLPPHPPPPHQTTCITQENEARNRKEPSPHLTKGSLLTQSQRSDIEELLNWLSATVNLCTVTLITFR